MLISIKEDIWLWTSIYLFCVKILGYGIIKTTNFSGKDWKGVAMPSIATHYLFGQAVYRQLIVKNRQDIIALLRKHKLDYNMGLQGPDPLFYYKPTVKNQVSACGHRIHREKGSYFLRNAAKYICTSKDIRALVYTMGFISHYTLDLETHDTVNALAPDPEGHIKLETELDREMLLREILERDARHRQEKYVKKHTETGGFKLFRKESTGGDLYFPLQFFSPRPSVRPEKIQRYKFIIYEKGLENHLAALYPGLTEKQLKNSLDSFIKYTKILYSPGGANLALLKQIQKASAKKYIFFSLAMTRKRYEEYVDSARKVVPIVDESAELAADMIINFHDAVKFGTRLSTYFDQSFN